MHFDALEVLGREKMEKKNPKNVKAWLLNPKVLKDFFENKTFYAGKYFVWISIL